MVGKLLVATALCVGLAEGGHHSAAANPIYPAKPLMTLQNTTSHGKRYDIATADGVALKVLHVYGSATEMGRASGELLGPIAEDFLVNALPKFYASEIGSIDLPSLPAWLQKLIKGAGAAVAPAVFGEALGFVLSQEHAYIQASRAQPLAEIDGMAAGLCSSGAHGDPGACDTTALSATIARVNMLPELIRMTCTMMGAWGKATATPAAAASASGGGGGLVQLRALDFGSGPFANYSVLTVYHPTEGNAFASLGFPGMVGAITGWSDKVALSEKVWETYDGSGVQPGHYDGEPVVAVIRDMLQFSDTKEDAVAFAQSIARTWAVFLGVGDAASGQFDALGYREANLTVYGPANVSQVTHMPAMEDLVYIDKHPQPSHDNVTMPALMAKNYGSITAVNTIDACRVMGTGDLHNAVYDFSARKTFLSLGTIDANGDYIEKACDRPYLEFDWDALFGEPQP